MSKELDIIYWNPIVLCISWYNKNYWFQNAHVSRTQGVRHVICIFLCILFRQGITVLNFIIVRYVLQILGGRGGGVFLWSSLPSILEQPPKRQVLNRAKTVLSINHDLKIYFDVISRSANARSPLGATAASLLFISCLIIL